MCMHIWQGSVRKYACKYACTSMLVRAGKIMCFVPEYLLDNFVLTITI